MKDVLCTLSQTIGIPDDAEIYVAPSGRATGIQLADGRQIKLQIAYELIETGADGEERYRDMTHDELTALDIDVGGLIDSDVEEA